MTQHQAWKGQVVLLVLLIHAVGFGKTPKCTAFSMNGNKVNVPESTTTANRRSFFTAVGISAMSVLVTVPSTAQAGINPTLLKSLPVQGDESGSTQRLRQIESIQRPSTDLVDIPYKELPSGVSFREYRPGKGDTGK